MDQLKDTFYALTSCFCQQDATLKLNGRSFKIIKVLGEGGFSYVYLAQDLTSSRLFALKKIRCPLGSDSVQQALKEVEAYKRFRHPNIIRCLDSCVVQDPEDPDGSKIIYLFLPFYQKGTCQDIITSNAVNGSHSTELDTLQLFLGTCLAVRAMHTYTPSRSSSAAADPSSSSSTSVNDPSSYPPTSSMSHQATNTEDEEDGDEEDGDEEDEGLVRAGEETEGQALIGGVEALKGAVVQEREDSGLPGLGDSTVALGKLGAALGKKSGGANNGVEPWAHRDIKPANIMLTDDSRPILMDFGSALPARIPIPNRQIALLQQDLAAEHCSMPFRAPELFDVKTGITLNEKVDIWSLGATLFAMAYGTSPFETTQQSEHGGSIAMAVMNGKYDFPRSSEGRHSEGFRDLIRMMLKVDPKQRPDIHQVITSTEAVIARLR
ncbi:NAK protein kinase [Microbotryum lychnidis-dioicae p1A1 Lamole]|uniref:non-specific serine/threonine protein kinase n=1 Tax=Microbotryum lychnidis-dioicae (strain p1A1 Lamole / MvSl-1064) TaxID=683840 RepID=U5HB21_USTV1|nr:NAK protein kinase [Microbotryum lychnidis-dioicae p1A1 Lamole]|eukprot:KDE05248.1 NAK protein kinase [Microbotryum lychnidis-dioicae p1A1 Lamole]